MPTQGGSRHLFTISSTQLRHDYQQARMLRLASAPAATIEGLRLLRAILGTEVQVDLPLHGLSNAPKSRSHDHPQRPFLFLTHGCPHRSQRGKHLCCRLETLPPFLRIWNLGLSGGGVLLPHPLSFQPFGPLLPFITRFCEEVGFLFSIAFGATKV